MKLYRMAQIDPITNKIVHISIWDDPSKAPELVEVPDLAMVGITLDELTQITEDEKTRIMDLEKLITENALEEELLHAEEGT